MSANHAPSGPSALKSRLTRSGAAFARGAAGFSPPFGLLAQPRAVPDGPPLAHDARHAPARGAHAVPPGLGVPLVARAGAAGSPRAVALPGRLERRAHLGDRPGPLVGLDERGLSPLRPRACSCPPAEGALASKGVSLSLFGRSLSRLSPRRSSAIRKGLSPAGARAASALLTQSDRPPGSMPGSRAASAWVPPRPLRSLTACCLDPAECLGDGCPVPCPPSPLTASCPNGTRRVDGNGGDSPRARPGSTRARW